MLSSRQSQNKLQKGLQLTKRYKNHFKFKLDKKSTIPSGDILNKTVKPLNKTILIYIKKSSPIILA